MTAHAFAPDFLVPPSAEPPTNRELIRYFNYMNQELASYETVTASKTVDQTITLANSSSATTMTLPTASNARHYTIKNINTGVVTVACTGSETIDGRSTWELQKYHAVTVVSDGTNWMVVSSVRYYKT